MHISATAHVMGLFTQEVATGVTINEQLIQISYFVEYLIFFLFSLLAPSTQNVFFKCDVSTPLCIEELNSQFSLISTQLVS